MASVNVQLSALEAAIVLSIDHCGWHAYLWFPIVQRELLNFGFDAPDEEVHRALRGLIRKGWLREVPHPPDPRGLDLAIPDWIPSADALAAAKAKWNIRA